MKTYKKKYNRYLLTYPMPGNKVYKTQNLDDAIKKCYKEFKTYNDIQDGYFGIVNMDTNEEYKFTAKNNNIYRVKQRGGFPSDNQSTNIFQEFMSSLFTKPTASQTTSSVGPTEELTVSPLTEMAP